MGWAKADRIGSGLPQPASPRLIALAEGLREPSDPATFGEETRLAVAAVADRIRAESRSGELTEALAVLAHLRAGLERLVPASLVPRKGPGGLFDSRKRRLKALRATFSETTRTLSESLDDLQVRITAMKRRSGVLDGLWSEMLVALSELNVCVVMALHPSGSEAHAERGRRLAEGRDGAVRVLPAIRVVQNADDRAGHRLRLLCDALMEWHADWTDALGLKGRKPKKVRPDQARLTTSRDTVMALLDAAAREIELARSRRVEEDARTEAARRRL